MKTLEQTTVISAADSSLLQRVKATILKHLPTAKIVLYGSVARGTQHEDSDYNLLVLTDRTLSMDEQHTVRSDIYAIELDLDMQVLFFVMFRSEDRWKTPFFDEKEIEEDGIIV